jgi:hypothetical protein
MAGESILCFAELFAGCACNAAAANRNLTVNAMNVLFFESIFALN